MKKTIETIWEVWTYDVWGNARDGYEVNDRSCMDREYPMTLKVQVNNPGTEYEFLSAFPSAKQCREALGLGKVRLDWEGDDLHIYINRDRDGYPLGELQCISHASLSPIKKEVEE